MPLSELHRAALHAMREGILMIDREGRIVFANQAYLDFLGRTETEILGRPLREVRPGARLPEVLTTGKPILHAPRMEANDDVYFVNTRSWTLSVAVSLVFSMLAIISRTVPDLLSLSFR